MYFKTPFKKQKNSTFLKKSIKNEDFKCDYICKWIRITSRVWFRVKFGMARLWHIRADDNENPAWYNINASEENPKPIILRLLRRAFSSVLRRGIWKRKGGEYTRFLSIQTRVWDKNRSDNYQNVASQIFQQLNT